MDQDDELSSILSQPPEASAILLRHMRWNKERLIEQYMEKPEEILEHAGLGQDAETNPPKLQRIQGFCCDICCDDSPDMDTFAMKCGHRFCVDCYKQYLATKIQDEGEAARIRCPGEGCTRIVDSKSLDLLVSSELHDRYELHIKVGWSCLLTFTDITPSSHERTSTTKRTSSGVLRRTANTLYSAV